MVYVGVPLLWQSATPQCPRELDARFAHEAARFRGRQRRAAHRRTRRGARARRNGRWRWHAGTTRVLPVRAPASRLWALAKVPRRNACGERRDQGRPRASMTHSPFVAHHDAQGSIGVSPTYRKVRFWHLLAGGRFQVITYGRFWVITEGRARSSPRERSRRMSAAGASDCIFHVS